MTLPRVAVRTERGVLHMGARVGRRFETACYREITVAAAVVYDGRDRLGRRRADVAWKHERRCVDCEARIAKIGATAIAVERGW